MARAIKKLRILGGGFAVIPVGGRRLVQSVPGELNMDHTAVLQKAEVCTTTINYSLKSLILIFEGPPPTTSNNDIHWNFALQSPPF